MMCLTSHGPSPRSVSILILDSVRLFFLIRVYVFEEYLITSHANAICLTPFWVKVLCFLVCAVFIDINTPLVCESAPLEECSDVW